MSPLKTLNRILTVVIVLLCAGLLGMIVLGVLMQPSGAPKSEAEDVAQVENENVAADGSFEDGPVEDESAAIDAAAEEGKEDVVMRVTDAMPGRSELGRELLRRLSEQEIPPEEEIEKFKLSKLDDLPEPYRSAAKKLEAEKAAGLWPNDGTEPPPEVDETPVTTSKPRILRGENEHGYSQSYLAGSKGPKNDLSNAENKEAEKEREEVEFVPAFQINGIASADFDDEIFVLNMFSMWCTDSEREMAVFQNFSEVAGVPMYGVNIFPRATDAPKDYFKPFGDPYEKWGRDDYNLISGAFSLYQTPSTYVVSGKDMKVLWAHHGEITQKILDEDLLPAIENAKFKISQNVE
ncbi:MAG: hypothetical protein KTR28_06240 [Micavibrio sp.]|nr:hypothetical protein [Micavibrio sp.]